MQLVQRSVLPVFAILLGGLLALAILPIAPAMAAVDSSSSQTIDLEIVTDDGAVAFATVTMDNDEEKLTVKNSLDHSESLHVEDRDIGADLESGKSASLDVSSLKPGAYTLALSGHG